MSFTWENALQHYRSQHFQVFTREQLLHASFEALTNGIPVSPATIKFFQGLALPHLSLWEAFFAGVQSVHNGLQEHDVFTPLRHLLNHTKHVAILYGEHFAWKSPDRWSYLFEILNGNESKYIIIHPPGTNEHIQQAEAVLGISLPPTYFQFLHLTNGLGKTMNEFEFICGAGSGRAAWDLAVTFQSGAFHRDSYHEIASYWFQWQVVLAYERQRDRETGINTYSLI